MIKLSNVNKYFYRKKKNEIHVINNATLEFERTGLVALLGPSGCGKTTLLNVIGGLDKVYNGQITINNQRITKRRVKKVDEIRCLSIGYIFQNYNLLDNLTVFENVAIVLKMIGIKNQKEIREKVNYVLEKVGIYRYRNRLAGMLSGGERQRVGIARALVKNPDIILADEPTGNLDSKNTIEIMNIIKSISNDKLVLLVTHERDLAHFYASRIIEIKDGKVDNDYNNDHENDLDYRFDNRIYLKDLNYQEKVEQDKIAVNYYSNNAEKILLDIVVVNNNIYIKSDSKEKIEIVDTNSSVEFINDHYQKITKKEAEKYKFDMTKLENKKVRYVSIYNPINLLVNGFKKIRDYSVLKKILLLGFFVSGMFTLFGLSNIFGSSAVYDRDFVKNNKDHILLKVPEGDVEKYLEYEKMQYVDYMIPSNSSASFKVIYDNYYQTIETHDVINGSLTDRKLLKENMLKYGKLPIEDNEVVIDKLIIDNNLKKYIPQQMGYKNIEDFIGLKLSITNMGEYKVVGITDLESPNIYVEQKDIINIAAIAPGKIENQNFYTYMMEEGEYELNELNYYDYELFKDEIKLTKGNYPENDYEVLVNENNKYSMPLNKTIDQKINDKKLKVVGYYSDVYNRDLRLVNNNMIKYELIKKNKEYTIISNNKKLLIEEARSKGLNVTDTYLDARNKHIKDNYASKSSAIIVAVVILAISFVEIFLIIRSSFLSRIKEVGILRAIGMKKKDIYKMFLGEIIAITSTASILGIAFMHFVLDRLTTVEYFAKKFTLNPTIVLISIVLVYGFNLIVGLLPVFNVIRKTPAHILSRTDID